MGQVCGSLDQVSTAVEQEDPRASERGAFGGRVSRIGGWLAVRGETDNYLQGLAKDAKDASRSSVAWNAKVQEFYEYACANALVRMKLEQGIAEGNSLPQAAKPLYFENMFELFQIINYVVTTVSPAFDNPNTDGLVGCPLNAFLDCLMFTPAGQDFFNTNKVNEHVKEILTVWCQFLDSPASTMYLNDRSPDGWYSKEAKPFINMDDFIVELPNDPAKYPSWNAFFTRKFKPGVRPVAAPEAWNNKIITSGCESKALHVSLKPVKLQDTFWLKAQPYSLQDIFALDAKLAGVDTKALAEKFVGGCVYQAFLSACSYHCWHSPVNGKIKHLYIVPGGIGTYYSELLVAGFDPEGPDLSQGYLSAVAVRTIFIIEADDPSIGDMAVVQIGMAEVSSCVALVKQGDKVKKGDLIGEFKFGGSTFLNIFRKGVIKEFCVKPGDRVLLNTQLAIAN
ncbi:unnamed protein product [Polarella glacialis]|uniref:L-tryptophan decarboxylase PsiD-like domain-containing protein n=1 Tax=Polarella glacialis TaxID=89957 RepID=A0A813FA41_POLGL|nr:unnamed protein product [Polarella glacialis]